MDEVTRALVEIASSPWIYPALFLLVVADAFLVVLPSETVVVAVGSLAGATGEPAVVLLLPIAAALARVRRTVLIRPAVLIFTARYIPYARIAVNLSAGAVGLPARRFLPLSAVAGTAWAIYNLAVGALFGQALASTPLLAIGVSVAVAITLGIAVDLVVQRIARRRAGNPPALGDVGA